MNRIKKLSMVICVVGFLDLMAVSMIIPLLLPEIVKLGASPTIAGLVSSIYGAVQLFSSPIMGRWSDRIGRRNFLVICLVAISCSYGFLGCALSISTLAIARLLLGLCKHSQTMCRTYLCDVSPPEKQTKQLSFFNASSSIGFIVGPTVGGHLAESPSGFFNVCMLTSAIFLFNSGLVKLFLSDYVPGKAVVKAEMKAEQTKVRVTWSEYWDLFMVRFLLNLGPILFRNNFSLIVLNLFHLSTKQLGYITSFQAFIGTVTGFFGIGFITRFYPSNQRLTLHFVFLLCVSLLLLSLCPTVTWLVVCLIPLNLSTTVCRVSVTKQLVDQTDPVHRGAMLGMSQSVSSLARMVAPLLAGLLQEWSDRAPAFVSSLIVLVAFVFLLTGTWKGLPQQARSQNWLKPNF